MFWLPCRYHGCWVILVCFVDIIDIVVNSATGVAVFGNNIFSSSKEDRNNKGDEQRRKQRKASVRIRLTLPGCERIPFRDGLTKIHKPGCPFRPIVFSVNTYNYNLASYLIYFCQFPQISSQSRSLLVLRTWPSHIYNHNNEVMCSFYFSSLFTIVPLDETIQFCLNKQAICSPRSTKTIPLRLKVLLELATKKTEPFYFLWSVLPSN